MATVKAKPYEYKFAPEKTALIVIDMQRDFIEPGGFGETLGNNVALLAAIVPTVKKLARYLPQGGHHHHPYARSAPPRPVRPAACQAQSRQSEASHRRPERDGSHPHRR